VLRRTYDNQNCSIARALETIGERWTLLILRDAFLGTRRFDDFQRSLGIARNVLAVRLKRLTEQGLLERSRYQERPERYEYRLTDKGADLWPVLFTLMRFGDKHSFEGMPPTVVEHGDCGARIDDHMCCPACGGRAGRPARRRRAPRRERRGRRAARGLTAVH
jgi:DNA-binding HxlR family transcriptional regulator